SSLSDGYFAQIGWKVAPSNGGMFIWAKYPSDKDDVQFVYEVIEKTGVVMVPGSVFGTEGKGYVRIALVQDTEKLERAVKKRSEEHTSKLQSRFDIVCSRLLS